MINDAAERVRRGETIESLQSIYGTETFDEALIAYGSDRDMLIQDWLSQQPTYSDLADRLAAAEAEHVNTSALISWIRDPQRKPPHLAFTAGPTREIADWILVTIAAAEARLARYDDARPLTYEEAEAALCYDGTPFTLAMVNGEILISINIDDFKPRSIGNFAKLLDALGVKP